MLGSKKDGLVGVVVSSLENVHLPESPQSLDVSSNKLQRLADFAFPTGLEKLNLDDNGLTEISNVTFPAAAGSSVSLLKNAIRAVHLTNSQWDAFENTFRDSKDLVLETRPTSVPQCTTGHYGQENPTAFSTCLLEA